MKNVRKIIGAMVMGVFLVACFSQKKDPYSEKKLVRDRCMSCHDLAFDKPNISLLSMCQEGNFEHTLLYLKQTLLITEKLPVFHDTLFLSENEIESIANFVCHPYDPLPPAQ